MTYTALDGVLIAAVLAGTVGGYMLGLHDGYQSVRAIPYRGVTMMHTSSEGTDCDAVRDGYHVWWKASKVGVCLASEMPRGLSMRPHRGEGERGR